MRPDPSGIRWKCPHCDVGLMKLRSADRHLKRKHYDCLSCQGERLLVQALMQGRGWLSPAGSDPFTHTSRV